LNTTTELNFNVSSSMPRTWLEQAGRNRTLRAMLAQWRRWRAPKTLGQLGEAAAERHLKRLGYKIVARGLRLDWGELDLVAVEGRTVVFVEVKTRRSTDAGHPADAVTLDKQRRITRLALGYLKRHNLLDCASRFDVIAVTWPASARQPAIEHFKAAFSAVGNAGMYG
jgi:putative endonuclease